MICWFGADFSVIYLIILTETGTMPSLLVINLFVYLCRGNRRAGLRLCFLGCWLFPTRALGAVWHWHCVLKIHCFPQPCRQERALLCFYKKNQEHKWRHIVINYVWFGFFLPCCSSLDPTLSPDFLMAQIKLEREKTNTIAVIFICSGALHMEGIIFDGKFLFDITVELKGKGIILGLGFHKCHRQMGSF